MKLSESPFVYEKYGIKFYFSSEFYLKKFMNEVEKFIDEETMKLEIRYKIPISAGIYFMFVYYKKVEKRGYRVVYNGMEFPNSPVFSFDL